VYREGTGKPPSWAAAARKHARYVAALRAKAKTQRHAKTGLGRVVLLQLRAGHTEGSRTHYLAGSGVPCGNLQGVLLVKNKLGHYRQSICPLLPLVLSAGWWPLATGGWLAGWLPACVQFPDDGKASPS
jgi:hypothetical protein